MALERYSENPPANSQNSSQKNVLIMAAGTGGHVFPALAVATELRAQGVNVHWLATMKGMEHRLLANTEIPIHPIDIQGLRGNGVKRLLVAPFKILAATVAAMRLIRQLKIDAVVGFGGYVAGPGGLAARLSGVPLIIHEQNAIAGFTNKQLGRIARKILQAFPGAFPEQAKVITTGNPVRQEICQVADPVSRYDARGEQPLNILIVGGSLGAQALNERIPAALAKNGQPLIVKHQCGQQQLEATQQRYAALNASQLQYEVLPFIQNMAEAYANADLIICRAGALTVTEVATAGVPAVFVPLPIAVDDHQTANAKYLANAGAALICQQAGMTSDSLAQALQPILNRSTLKQMAVKARQLAQPEATQDVSRIILSTIQAK